MKGAAMRLLVVGAGASYAEAKHAGLPDEFCPPLMKDFAARMWRCYNSHYLLSAYLLELGHDPGADARERFISIAKAKGPDINVERFFEFAYKYREWVPPGHEHFHPASEYENLLLHGILNPLSFLLVDGLFKNGVETTPLPLTQTVASHLQAGDTVLNLNYDTIFEIGAEQAGHELVFLPNKPLKPSLAISKPHGSMNLFVNMERRSFWFARPLFAGSVQPSDGSRSYYGILPPRLNKQYVQHPVAQLIIEATEEIGPGHIIFWGIGLTDSDTDLLDLYRRWCQRADQVDFINPSFHDVERAKKLLGTDVQHYHDVTNWHQATRAASDDDLLRPS
jgi:hypothetical protein